MRSGSLRQVGAILIDGDTAGRNRFGEQARVPLTVAAHERFSIEPLSGAELLRAQQTEPDVTHRVRMRFRRGLTPKHWIEYTDGLSSGKVTLGIVSVHDLNGRGRELELMCRELV